MTDDSNKKYISIINDGTNTLYIKDAEARTAISGLEEDIAALGNALHFLGTSTTAIYDGLEMVDSNPSTGQIVEVTIAGQAYRKSAPGTGDSWKQLKSGDIAIYKPSGADHELEFVYNDTTHKWQEFGSTGALKSLAFKDPSDIEVAAATSQNLVTTTITGVSGSTSVTGVDGSETIYGCGDNTTVHDTPSLGKTGIHPCAGETSVGSASGWSAGTMAHWAYTQNTETLAFTAGSEPSLTVESVDVATYGSEVEVGTSIVEGDAITVATKASSSTTVPVAASSATTVPVAAENATTVATGSVANNGAGASVVTAASQTIQAKAQS